MLARSHRMTTAAQFRASMKGRRAGGPVVVLHLTSMVNEPTRVGFVVSKAVGGSVQRNRVKRRLREAMRERLSVLPEGSQVVVRAQPEAARSTFSELTAALDRQLDRLMKGAA